MSAVALIQLITFTINNMSHYWVPTLPNVPTVLCITTRNVKSVKIVKKLLISWPQNVAVQTGFFRIITPYGLFS